MELAAKYLIQVFFSFLVKSIKFAQGYEMVIKSAVVLLALLELLQELMFHFVHTRSNIGNMET